MVRSGTDVGQCSNAVCGLLDCASCVNFLCVPEVKLQGTRDVLTIYERVFQQQVLLLDMIDTRYYRYCFLLYFCILCSVFLRIHG